MPISLCPHLKKFKFSGRRLAYAKARDPREMECGVQYGWTSNDAMWPLGGLLSSNL
jgi:hypothetical protein